MTSRLRRHWFVVASMAVGWAFVADAAHAAGGGSADTRVQVGRYLMVGSGTPNEYEGITGSIDSDRLACANDRPINLFFERPGRDELIGSTISTEGQFEETFAWSVFVPDQTNGSRELEPGRYYAKAGSIAVGQQGCAAARSKSFRLGPTKIQMIISDFPNSNFTGFYGQLLGDQTRCLDDRKVTIFRERAGRDQKIGTTRTYAQSGNNFLFGLETDGPIPPALYYATVPAFDDCAAGRSPTERIGATRRASP